MADTGGRIEQRRIAQLDAKAADHLHVPARGLPLILGRAFDAEDHAARIEIVTDTLADAPQAYAWANIHMRVFPINAVVEPAPIGAGFFKDGDSRRRCVEIRRKGGGRAQARYERGGDGNSGLILHHSFLSQCVCVPRYARDSSNRIVEMAWRDCVQLPTST